MHPMHTTVNSAATHINQIRFFMSFLLFLKSKLAYRKKRNNYLL